MKTMKRNRRSKNLSPCFGFSCKVFYKSGINMVNCQKLPIISSSLGKIDWYTKGLTDMPKPESL